MVRNLKFGRNVAPIGIPIVLFITLIILIKTTSFLGNGPMQFAITFDLLLSIPFIYFLIIRKTAIPKTTVVAIMLLGLLIGTYILPSGSQYYLNLFKFWVLPVIEISVLTLVVYKIREAKRIHRRLEAYSSDHFTTMTSVCYDILPRKLVLPFVTELAVFYYGFINWKTRILNENEYSYHKRSGTPIMMYAFIMIIGVETLAFHLLISQWSLTAAWIFSGLSTYTAIQVFGFARSLSQRPIAISKSTLKLRYGILGECEISVLDIESIELSRRSVKGEVHAKKLSPIGELEAHNVIITLKREGQLTGPYGIKKPFEVIAFHVDEPIEFSKHLLSIVS